MIDPIKRKIKYTSRDFSSLRNDLISYAESYFPSVYRDFNEASPGMMFIEMSAYVGDVLSYYTDVQFKEGLLLEAEEKSNIIGIAQAFGYKPKLTTPATALLDFYQIVPAIGSGNSNTPDMRYAMIVDKNAVIGPSIGSGVNFITNDFVDFSYSSSMSPTEITVYEVDPNTNEPTFYLLKKSVNASSGIIRTKSVDFAQHIPYNSIKLEDSKIIEIIDAVDSEGNIWYNVDYLAQDTIIEPVQNIKRNDGELYLYADSTPYLLKLKKINNRFTTRLLSDNNMLIQFGPGVMGSSDELITPDPSLYGTLFSPFAKNIDISIDPNNFLNTKQYGVAPANTRLTFRYRVGGGLNDNVPQNTLTSILSRNIIFNDTSLDQTLASLVRQSLFVNNREAATGGKDAEDVNEIKLNALSYFAAQNRAVTKEDYVSRVYSMPSRFGSIAKAYVIPESQLSIDAIEDFQAINQNSLFLYTLSYDVNGKLTNTNSATKENILTYLSSYRIITDAINIKDAFIINIGINFEVTPQPEYNGYEVIANCISELASYFDIKKWQINQPIVISELYNLLDRVTGVQTVVNIEIVNLTDISSGYSSIIYNIEYAERNGTIYPSLDPSIFEVKYPQKDIRGRIV
jgi:hypothetical protein